MSSPKLKYLRLGASLYVPATNTCLAAIANRQKYPDLRSVIFCTEDSCSEADLPFALKNFEKQLQYFEPQPNFLRFLRVRNPEILKRCLEMPNIDILDGFVFPKITARNFHAYYTHLPAKNPYQLMPTLETREVFEATEMTALRKILSEVAPEILSIRIGGNDLLNLLGIRRNGSKTIYQTPMKVVIAALVTQFKVYGFNLTAPVCEAIYNHQIFQHEVPLDLDHGLFGKTIVYPDHAKIVESFYQVCEEDFEMAEMILNPASPAVFKLHGTMCEVTTHSNWAETITERAKIYGISGPRNIV